VTARLEGKVAFITGAARGQGRAHAIRMAQDGADIIAVDLCKQLDSSPYALADVHDLTETERAVKELGRRIVARQADVRERSELREAIQAGLTDLGRLDIVVANAGVCLLGAEPSDASAFIDGTDILLIGVMNTVAAALPHIPDHGSIIITGSTAAIAAPGWSAPSISPDPGGMGYAWSKQTVVSYSLQLALLLAPRFIRVNIIHPTNCNTSILHNDRMYRAFRPDLEHPTQEDVQQAFVDHHAMPVPYVEPEDIANMAAFLASDECRFVTGQQIRVDAGNVLKRSGGRG
jgi:SDR family mycofactocin-dependent oxidoreductase